MVHVLVLLKQPENAAMGLDARLRAAFPQLEVSSAESLAGAGDAVERAEILISLGVHLGADAGELYRRAKAVRWIQLIGAGVDNVVGHPGLPGDIMVTNVHGIHGRQVSEATLAAMLALARQLPRTLRNQDARRWERFAPQLLGGKTAGVFGAGAIAEVLTPLLKALGMTVVIISSTGRLIAGADEARRREDLETAVADLDHLVVLTPLTPQTRGVIDARILKAMKPSAYLINLARGGVVDDQALLEALQAGEIAGAALDVFSVEPLPADHPLWGQANVIVTPHIAGYHDGYGDQVAAVVDRNMRCYLAGRATEMINRVDDAARNG